MYEYILYAHSILRWIILLLLLYAFFKSVADRHKPFTPAHIKAGLFLMIAADLALLIGLYQWFAGDWGLKSIQHNGMGAVMKDPHLRFFAVEHTTGMLVAIILIHLGYAYGKKNAAADAAKHKRAILYYGLALLILLISIPWPFRSVGAGRIWFPGM